VNGRPQWSPADADGWGSADADGWGLRWYPLMGYWPVGDTGFLRAAAEVNANDM